MSAPETFRVRARRGDVSLTESSHGYFEVWVVSGSQGDPKRFATWEEAEEAFEESYAQEWWMRRYSRG